MEWLFLCIAGIFEMGWPIGMKMTQDPEKRLWGMILAIVSMLLSFYFLWLAQKTIPISTAYMVWTGIGAIGTMTIGIIFFGDSSSIWRLLSAFLVLAGILGLKLSTG
ncbi:MAG: DMT family transporter [Candidatus Kapaibacteriota bacterium]|jgi:quaternary ammonium compound-resistance protein SugE